LIKKGERKKEYIDIKGERKKGRKEKER